MVGLPAQFIQWLVAIVEKGLSSILGPSSPTLIGPLADWKFFVGLAGWYGVWSYWSSVKHEDRYLAVQNYVVTATMVLGFDFASLSLLQHVGSLAFLGVLLMNILNVRWTKMRFTGVPMKKPEGNKESSYDAGNVYENLHLDMLQVSVIFVGQLLLVSFVVYSSFVKYEPGQVTYGFWVTAYVAVQMSGFFKRGKDSQLGPTWDLERFKSVHRMNAHIEFKLGENTWHKKTEQEMWWRSHMGLWVNTLFRDVIAFVTPLLLLQSDSASDFVQNAFALSYITTLDDHGEDRTITFRNRQEEAPAPQPGLQRPLLEP